MKSTGGTSNSARTSSSALTSIDLSPTMFWLGYEHVSHSVSTKRTLDDVTEEITSHAATNRVFLHGRSRLGRLVGEFSIGAYNTKAEVAGGLRFDITSSQAISAFYQSRIRSFAPFSLEPVAIAGMLPNAAPSALDTRSKVAGVRWESEWSPRFFTVVEAQHQHHEQLLAPAEDAFLSTVRASPYSVNSQFVFVGKGDIDRLSFTANVLIAPTLALDFTAAATRSDHHNYLPRSYARGELVWTATPTIKATMSATYIGNRRDDAVPEGRPLDAVALFDAGVRWQSKRHNLEAALNVTNIFDDQVEVYNAFPRYGRAVVASIATHF